MALSSQDIDNELRRKAMNNILPTNQANMERYNQIKSTLPGQTKPAAQPATQQSNPYQLDPGQTFVRKTLEGAGFTDVDFDKTRQMVTAGGMDVLQPDKVVRGTSIASSSALDAAINRIRNQQNMNKTNELLGRLETTMNKPFEAPEFNYDPQNDPTYQAALRRAEANAQTATGNAMAEMNRRGLLNSTIMGDRAAQIQQGEFGRVSDELVPQLFQQAYNRHRDTVSDQYNQHRNQISDIANLLGTNNQLGQQALDNQFRDKSFDRGVLESDRAFDRGVLESDRGFDRGVFESDRAFNYTQGRDKVEDEKWKAEFDRIVKQDGIDTALAWARHNLDVRQENRISAGQSGGGSGGSAYSKEKTIQDVNQPRTVSAMETYLLNALPGGNKTAGPIIEGASNGTITPSQLTWIERQILDNRNLSDAERVKLYNRFGIPLPE